MAPRSELTAAAATPKIDTILARIPETSGRWIGCDAGWFELLVRLDAAIAELAADYEINQVKEKFGTLRFYWTLPDRHAGDRAALEDAIRALVAAAEAESARTCERCSRPGLLRRRNGWLKTLCGPCGDTLHYTS